MVKKNEVESGNTSLITFIWRSTMKTWTVKVSILKVTMRELAVVNSGPVCFISLTFMLFTSEDYRLVEFYAVQFDK